MGRQWLKDVLSKLLTMTKRHLGIEDDEGNLALFICSLFEQVSSKDDQFNQFKSITAANGGDMFPIDFLTEVFTLLGGKLPEKETKSAIRVKIEEAKLKFENSKVKSEFLGLSFPNEVPNSDFSFKSELKHERDEKKPFIKRENIDENYIKKEINNTLKVNDFKEGEIYEGIVKNLTPYGAFIKLRNSNLTGLCHVSHISPEGQRIDSPSSELKLDQHVYTKILSIEPSKSRVSLSMKYINQNTGDESRPTRRDVVPNDGRNPNKRRLTSPERWEISQLISAGVVSAKDYPELYEDPNLAFASAEPKVNDEDIDIEIELTNKEPKFLENQTKSVDYATVEIFRNPEGSLKRSATNGSQFAKEFKEQKLKIENEKIKKVDRNDPLSKSSTDTAKTENFIKEWKFKQIKAQSQLGKRTDLSIDEQRKLLPVYKMRDEVIRIVKDNQFVVIVGETGSGKTTQIVQYLLEEGLNIDKSTGVPKMIGCTQPRRVAAESVAKRVAEEVGTKVGDVVGYTIRFIDKTSPNTKIKYMTDGMLEREALNDPKMSKYSVIMLDEAHERTIATDVLFALLKKAAKVNPDLKIIITSATLDSNKFSTYFNKCPILKIPGRTFPVEVLYTREPEMDYLAAVLDSVVQIHISEPKGDILVFLTGQDEIDTCCEALFGRMKILGDTAAELIILPIYSSLPSEMQSRIFEPTPEGSRKVIVATNIAETSITIDGIYYVIDPGFVKLNAYDPKLGMDSLQVSPISQAQANQRSGRAGRTGPGKCYRLYTEKAYEMEMVPNTIPEIQRQNLSYTILMLKAMGINDLLDFEFMDPPPKNSMIIALHDLYILSALNEEGTLTELGRMMSEFPMEPALAKTLISSIEFGCCSEILSIVAMLSVQTIFYRPKDKQKLADQKKLRFHNSQGDHLTFLNVYQSWERSNYDKSWCQENFIQERSMKRALEVRKQLVSIMRKFGHNISSCQNNLTLVRKAICSGYFKNSAKKDAQGNYSTLIEKTPVSIHPSSALFGKRPEYVVYHTLLLTSKEYMHCASVIEPKWLVELAPNFFNSADQSKVQNMKKHEKIIPLHDKFRGEDWRLSNQHERKKRALESHQE